MHLLLPVLAFRRLVAKMALTAWSTSSVSRAQGKSKA